MDRKIEEITGYNASYFLQDDTQGWRKIIHPDDGDAIQQQLQVKLQQQGSYQLTYRIQDRWGNQQWLWDIGCGKFDSQGELLWLDGYIFPTDSDCQGNPHQEQTEKHSLLQAIPDTIFCFDRQRKLLECFPNESDRHAFSPETVTGKTIADIFPSDLADWFEYYCQYTLETSEIQKGEYTLSVNGTWHQYEARFTPSGTGKVLVIVRDISDRKRMEAELRMAQVTEHQKAKQLQETLAKLRHTQMQLVQSEKMSALGSMVAGIAHEINNPINFVSGNLQYAIDYANSLLSLVALYEKYSAETPAEIQAHIEDIDLDFLKADFPQLLNGMRSGVERIGEIVRSLRNFSRLDEAEKKVADIHEGLESTLAILQHRLKSTNTSPPIQIEKNYSQLSKIECHPGLLNQVFVNILSNAIDVLEAQKTNQQSKITITTKETQDNLTIQIGDNGPGITESKIQRIFEPFFTTKPPGKGTGLGLSISYSIVTEKHGGRLSCFSQIGEGTEFIIDLPKQTKIVAED